MTRTRVLITGGAGYLGSVLSQTLLARGYTVTVLDNLMWGSAALMHLCSDPEFDFVRGDARDEAVIRSLLQSADVVLPLAALVGAPLCDRDPWAARSTNLDAIRMLLRVRSPRQLLIYPTTNSGYGTKSGTTYCTEETPLEPISLYGVTKVEAEQAVLDTDNSLTLRLATVFGASPRMRLDLLVNHFVYVAQAERYIVIFEKDFKRNYIHIRDVADCVIHCIENSQRMQGRPYNAGLDEANLSKWELAHEIKRHVPDFVIVASEIGSDPDKRNYIVSNQRLREAGFTARRSIDEGVRELLKAYRTLGRSTLANV